MSFGTLPAGGPPMGGMAMPGGNMLGVGGNSGFGQVLQMLIQQQVQAMLGPGYIQMGSASNAMYAASDQTFMQEQQRRQQAALAIEGQHINRMAYGAHMQAGGSVAGAAMTGDWAAQHWQKYGQIYSAFAPDLPDVIGGTKGSQQRMMMQLGTATRYRRDPVTGTMEGPSREAYTETLGRAITDELWGDGTNRVARGFSRGRIGELTEVGMRHGVITGGISAAQRKEAESANPADRDQMLRGFDAKNAAKQVAGLAGAMSAMEEIFGPGKPMEQLLASLNALTQNGQNYKSPQELEQTVRKLQRISQISGVGIQEIMQLQAVGAEAAAQVGASRHAGMNAGEGAASLAKAAMGVFSGADYRAAGTNLDEMKVREATLRGQAAGSRTTQQLGATLRLAEQEGAGKDLQLMAQAIKDGNTTYTNSKGETKQVAFKSQAEWEQFMKANNINQSDASAAFNARASALAAANKYDVGGRVTREYQWEHDIAPRIQSAYKTAMAAKGISGKRADAAAAAIAEHMRSYTADPDKSDEANEKAFHDAQIKVLKEHGITGQVADSILMRGMGNADDDRKLKGYGGARGAALQHNTKLMQDSRRVSAESAAMAKAATSVAHIGKGTTFQRLADLLGDGKVHEPKEFLAAFTGAVKDSELEKVLSKADIATLQKSFEDIQRASSDERLYDKKTGWTEAGKHFIGLRHKRIAAISGRAGAAIQKREDERGEGARDAGAAASPPKPGEDPKADKSADGKKPGGDDIVGKGIKITGTLSIPKLADLPFNIDDGVVV